ncbi:hypothetical protein EV426DRAFT_577865 [Tirmania nivea]|nr:hypothetical protein EV426DRAFT_577865 [Tirmania nivea]
MRFTTRETLGYPLSHEQRPISQLDSSVTLPDDINRNLPTLMESSNYDSSTAGTYGSIDLSERESSISVDSNSLRVFVFTTQPVAEGNNNSGGAHTTTLREASTPCPHPASPAAESDTSPSTDLMNPMERFLCISPHDTWTPQNLRGQLGQDSPSYETPYCFTSFLEGPAEGPSTSECFGNDGSHVRNVLGNANNLGPDRFIDNMYIEGTKETPWASIMAVLLD